MADPRKPQVVEAQDEHGTYYECEDFEGLDAFKAEVIQGVRRDIEEIKSKEREGKSVLRDLVFR